MRIFAKIGLRLLLLLFLLTRSTRLQVQHLAAVSLCGLEAVEAPLPALRGASLRTYEKRK